MKQTTTITVVTEFRDSNGQPVKPAAPEIVVPNIHVFAKDLLTAYQRSKDSDRNFDPNAK